MTGFKALKCCKIRMMISRHAAVSRFVVIAGADAAEPQSSRDLWGKLMFEPAKVRPSQRSDLKYDCPQQKRNQEGLTNTDLRHTDFQGQQAVGKDLP